MKITIFLQRKNKKRTVALRNGATVEDLLKKLSLNPEVVLVARNKEIILSDTPLKDHDNIQLLSVISGG